MSTNLAVLQTPSRLPIPTPEEPIPSLVGEAGPRLLMRRPGYQSARECSPEEVLILRQTIPLVLASVEPATLQEIAVQLEALQLHYPALKRSLEETKSWAKDWLFDIGHLPKDLLVEACRAWRQSERDKFPSPGQFLALVEPIYRMRVSLAKRARDTLEELNSKYAA